MNIQVTQIKALVMACVTLISSHSFAAMQPSGFQIWKIHNNSAHDLSIKRPTSFLLERFSSTETRKCFFFPSDSTVEFFVCYDDGQSCHVSIPSNSTRITLTRNTDTLIVAHNTKEITRKEIKLEERESITSLLKGR